MAEILIFPYTALNDISSDQDPSLRLELTLAEYASLMEYIAGLLGDSFSFDTGII